MLNNGESELDFSLYRYSSKLDSHENFGVRDIKGKGILYLTMYTTIHKIIIESEGLWHTLDLN